MSYQSPEVVYRFKAIEAATNRHPRKFDLPKDDLGRSIAVSDYFGQYTFGVKEIKGAIPRGDFDRFLELTHNGQQIGRAHV